MTVYKMITDGMELDEEKKSFTGLLLMYKDCFINKITCSQENAYTHLKKLLISGVVTDLKVLHHWAHVPEAQFKNWYMVVVPNLGIYTDDPKSIGKNNNKNPTHYPLKVLTRFNDLCDNLATKSQGYLSASVTEKLINEVPHMIPKSKHVSFSCHQSCLQDVQELLEDYHQLRHPMFYIDKIWPKLRRRNSMWISHRKS
uniref:Uncharacterized protein n=1 Tax=Cacopsylla melanoneura TaxID=428564 RepID=A0A8D9DQE1_9HEMI